MSNKTIGKDIANPIQREQFIKDNADGMENKGYMKAYTPEQLQGHKGRFCTKERHYADKAFLALSKCCIFDERDVLELKQRIKELESKNG